MYFIWLVFTLKFAAGAQYSGLYGTDYPGATGGLPGASGIQYPGSSGIHYPGASGIQYPGSSGIHYPRPSYYPGLHGGRNQYGSDTGHPRRCKRWYLPVIHLKRWKGCRRGCGRDHVIQYSLVWGNYCARRATPPRCRDAICSECVSGYYLFTSRSGNRCVKRCPIGYEETFHLTCKRLMCRIRHHKTILDENNKAVSCQRRCPTNHEERYSLHWGHHCRPKAIPKGCLDSHCTVCKEGYRWVYVRDFKKRCVEKCPEGYTPTPYRTCKACSIKNCDSCLRRWDCMKCKKGLSLYRTAMKSTTCAEKCPKGNEKVVVRGKDWCKEVVLPVTEKKKEFPEGCLNNVCTQCKGGYVRYVLPNTASLCLKKCPQGYAPQGNVCLACSDRRCASCNTSLVECERCRQGYVMMLDSRNVTLECVRNCPHGYHVTEKDNGTRYCIKDSKDECMIGNCEECLSSELNHFHKACSHCKEGFKLFRGNYIDHCYEECPPNYYEDKIPATNSSVCSVCKTPFCSKCTSGGDSACVKCIEPFVLDFATRRCTLCPNQQEYSFQFKRCVPADIQNVAEAENKLFEEM